ncbi:glycosyltransferase family 25 protein [Aureimonas populi]|uniref:Glycosyltransferase family 25 protein n=1 Tax=Aureimonas populi TaxID=1701758 RepID=A0ABW5CI78_9HYPH|nr:glycosyltransferase family 25 protein [Aureimonas populi]
MIPCRFINLDRAGERRLAMERQGRRLGLGLERVRAVEAAEITPARAAALGRSWERPLSLPELACFLSHHALWERIVEEGRPALILEDDAVLSPRILDALAAAEALEGVDLLNFEDFGKRRFVARHGARPLGPGLSRIRLYRDKAGSAAYLLWPSGARKLLLRAEKGAAPADAFIHGAGLEAWLCEPALAAQTHVLAQRGIGAQAASSVQARRERLAVAPANARFLARRVGTQLRLALHHAARLTRADYRRVALDEGVRPDAGEPPISRR